MDFLFTEEQKMLKTLVRDFVEKELEPIAARIDEEAEFPSDFVRKMGELGLPGIPFPEEYGGTGGGSIQYIIVVEELARVCGAMGVTYTCYGLAGKPILKFGGEEQRRRFIPPAARGEILLAFALTEPEAGTDAAAVQTTATRKEGGYVLNGNKIFVSNGGVAGLVLVFVTVDRSLKHRGMTAFVVEKGTPGFTVGKSEHKMGMRASSTTELVFQDCFVPQGNLLGKEGDGFKIAMAAVDSSRIAVAAQAVGIAQAALEKSLAYAKERRQFGQPIISFQAIQWMLADMTTQIDAARLLTYRAAFLEQSNLPFVKESCMAKLFAPEVAVNVTSKAVQIFGGYGYVKEYPVERYYRDARICGIFEGTDEVQRMTIAQHLMSEP